MQSCGTASDARKPSSSSSSASDSGSSSARNSAMAGRSGVTVHHRRLRPIRQPASARASAQGMRHVEREREHEHRAGLMHRGERQRHDVERASRCRARPAREHRQQQAARRCARARGGIRVAQYPPPQERHGERERPGEQRGGRTARWPCSRRSSSTTARASGSPAARACPFISGNVLYAKPARMPATKPPRQHHRRTPARRRRAPGGASRDAHGARASRARKRERQRGPQHRGEDRERERQVRGQPELRHARIVDQPAFHHVPAERALQAAEHEDRRRAATRSPRGMRRRTRNHRNGTRNATPISAPEQPVEVFPPEDALELGERHPVIDVAGTRASPGIWRTRRPSRRRDERRQRARRSAATR